MKTSSLRPLLTFVAALTLFAFLTPGCIAPRPTLLHEMLPAYVPAWGPPESRFGYHRAFWTGSTNLLPIDYFTAGCRVGQKLGFVAFEQGLTAMAYTSGGLAGAEAAVALDRPAIALRGSWQPVYVEGQTATRYTAGFDPDRSWQVSLVGGSHYQPQGLGWAAGCRVGRQAFGPVLFGEFGSGVLSLRTEISAAFPAPWADSTTKGSYLSIGIGAAHHGRRPR